MTKLTKSSLILFIVLLFGNPLLDTPRILSGYYSTDVDAKRVIATMDDAGKLADDRNWRFRFNGPTRSVEYTVVYMISHTSEAIWSKIKFGFSISILLLTMIILGIIYQFERKKINQLVFIGIVAVVGFLFALGMQQTTDISGRFYFSLTVSIILLLSIAAEFKTKWNWVIVAFLTTFFYLSLNEWSLLLDNDVYYNLMIEARIGTTLYSIFGFISESIYFIAPLYFIIKNSDILISNKEI